MQQPEPKSPKGPSLLEKGQSMAMGADYRIQILDLQSQNGQLKVVLAAVFLLLAWVVGALAYTVVKPMPAYITHLGEDGVYGVARIGPEVVEQYTMRFLSHSSSLYHHRPILKAQLSKAMRMVHPSYRTPFKEKEEERAHKILSAGRVEHYTPIRAASTRASSSQWRVQVYGIRYESVNNQKRDPYDYCYEIIVGEDAPSVEFPAGLSIRNVASGRCHPGVVPEPGGA